MNLGRLFLVQNGLCFHCGMPMHMRKVVRLANGQHNAGYTVEHIYPVSTGGRRFRNIVLAHLHCNHRRGDRMPTEEMVRRCEEIWDAAVKPSAKLVRTSLMRMGWRNERTERKRIAQRMESTKQA